MWTSPVYQEKGSNLCLVCSQETGRVFGHTKIERKQRNRAGRRVQETLERLMHNRTTIIIAHRLTTVQNADNVVVIEKGHIIEQGNHDALLEREGTYYRLYTRSFEAVIVEQVEVLPILIVAPNSLPPY